MKEIIRTFYHKALIVKNPYSFLSTYEIIIMTSNTEMYLRTVDQKLRLISESRGGAGLLTVPGNWWKSGGAGCD